MQIKHNYYTDAVEFCRQMGEAAAVIDQLMHSRTKSDVVEAVEFCVEAHKSKVTCDVRSMLHLVFSTDTGDVESRSVREHVIQAFHRMYLSVGDEQVVQQIV